MGVLIGRPIRITNTLPIPHVIISVRRGLVVVVGHRLEPVKNVIAVLGHGGIRQASLGIGDIRLQQGAVAGFIVVIAQHRTIGLGLSLEPVAIVIGVCSRASTIGGSFPGK